MLKVYGIKNCDSVKKALKFFQQNGMDYEFHDFKSQELPLKTIDSWLEKTDMKTLFNTRSTTYRTLQLKELHLDAAGQKEWLFKENLLIKRPVVEYNDTLLVGFKEETYKRSFQ